MTPFRLLAATIALAIASPAALPADGKLEPKNPTPEEQAQEAYRTTIRAFNEQQRETYLAGFAPTLECFYRQREMPVAKLAKARVSRWIEGEVPMPADNEGGRATLETWHLEVVAALPNEVSLVDYGRWIDDVGWPVPHAKHIVMRRTRRGWQIVAEFGRADKTCPLAKRFSKLKRPKRFTECVKALKAYKKSAFPHCPKRNYASNGCQMMLSSSEESLAGCWRTGKFEPSTDE